MTTPHGELKFREIAEPNRMRFGYVSGQTLSYCELEEIAGDIASDLGDIFTQLRLIRQGNQHGSPENIAHSIGRLVLGADLLATRAGYMLEPCVREAFERSKESLGPNAKEIINI